MGTHSLSLAEALPLEIKRVKEIIEMYRDPVLNGVGELAAHLMEMDIQKAEEATLNWDTIKMIRAYNALKEYTS